LLSQFGIELLLQIHIFNNGFDNEISVRQGIAIGSEGDFGQERFGLGGCEFFFRDEFVDGTLDAGTSSIEEGGFGFVRDDVGVDVILGGGHGGGLGDAVAHEAEADDAEFVKGGRGWGRGGDGTATAELAEECFGFEAIIAGAAGGPPRKG